MACALSQKKPIGLNEFAGLPCWLPKPTTWPRLLRAVGVFHAKPPSTLPRSIGGAYLFSQSTACSALVLPAALAQRPEIPTISPKSLIAVAAEEGSGAKGES